MLAVLEKMMDKLCGLEDKLHEKAERRCVEDLESRVRKLEEYVVDSDSKVKQLEDSVRQVDERMKESSDKFGKLQHSVAIAEREVAVSLEEERETEKRKNNLILYRVPEIESEVADDRKAGDMLFLHELCNDVLGVTVVSGDLEGMYRLGKREVGKVRPLLVKFSNEELKRRVMGRTEELRNAGDKLPSNPPRSTCCRLIHCSHCNLKKLL